ncbi:MULTISPECIES: fumarylacetoacetase [Streptomyces]|uniref:fumarylacetoacetase n=2 Tax=Streptomyces TaxID=1883 RepID=A0A1D8G4L1_9ACTN|nr:MULTISPECIES: fumarylacetoacetase [Streptomyces]AOT60402.1 Fumarylacetoacetate (FAA) hydrolase family protein [Streptomyces rubrolavendulae]KAF0650689.1 fumarylacetoacetase [Streptomyces fradiae ATCC 10745 = DSM 40063]OSY53826.1 Fumarylacetoacetate (FAA) hydrolase family protein [Streptomyces fradiae ATCC 10745 = DSM 40063]QEV13524.1 fumarylacetoacetase [Streptomyces fradiae ATCC 10745 = DSM 40063]UQS31228.1 fumarylacetoacetase [Streptomyces fradiae]
MSEQPEPSPLDLAEGDPFGPHNLPYGVFSTADEPARRRIGVRIGGHVLDAGAAAHALGSSYAGLLAQPSLNPLMAAGRTVWRDVRRALTAWLTSPAHRADVEPLLYPLDAVTLHLPYEVADYVDFYASEHHASNVGRMFRPDGEPLTPNWKHLPIGYHGRSGTVVVSGTDVVRPSGQRKAPADPAPVFGPSVKLDIEAEVGFVVGTPSERGRPVALGDYREHVFGLTLLNDWSARDIQAWEYVPLGPFLGKSFATSVSAWVTPLEALDAARVAPPARDLPLLPYLDDADEDEPGGYDLHITVRINGEVVAEPPFSTMYWTAAQQLAHMTVNGASLRTGDLYGSGTVSGPEVHQRGSLLELTWNGRDALDLPTGKRTFLEDGDEVTLTAWAPGPDGTKVGLGEVTGRITPAV